MINTLRKLFLLLFVATLFIACNKDENAPVITINGENPLSHCVNFLYFDPGATALDDEDGDISDKIVSTGSVIPSEVGTYTITYSVEDNTGNRAKAIRTVEVINCK